MLILPHIFTSIARVLSTFLSKGIIKWTCRWESHCSANSVLESSLSRNFEWESEFVHKVGAHSLLLADLGNECKFTAKLRRKIPCARTIPRESNKCQMFILNRYFNNILQRTSLKIQFLYQYTPFSTRFILAWIWMPRPFQLWKSRHSWKTDAYFLQFCWWRSPSSII